jgi:uncharacterized protein
MPITVRRVALAVLLTLWAGSVLRAQEVKIPRPPDRWATDTAGFLSPSAVASLDRRLEEFERRTGHQLLVYVGKTTGGVPIRDWGIRAFDAWKVGRKGIDDGLILFIMADDRQMAIEVGYGLEEKVPDVMAFRVIDRILTPGFQKGERDAAVAAAVESLIAMITGEAPPGEIGGAEGDASRPPSVVNKIFVAVAVIFFLILFITNPSLALWLLFVFFSGGRGGGGGGRGGFGGGGFRGGGGRAGGGGASGSW